MFAIAGRSPILAWPRWQPQPCEAGRSYGNIIFLSSGSGKMIQRFSLRLRRDLTERRTPQLLSAVWTDSGAVSPGIAYSASNTAPGRMVAATGAEIAGKDIRFQQMTTKPRTLLPPSWRAGIFMVLFSTAAAAQTEPGDPGINFLFSGEEIVSAIILVGITIVIHGMGMVFALRAALTFKRWTQTHRFKRLFVAGLGPVILAGWIIFMTHLVEVWAWALFLYGVGAIPNLANAYYFSLLQYATVGSDMTLPFHWRGFAGALPIAGLLSFAWSAAIMVTLSADFQAEHLKILDERRSKRR